MILSPLRRDTVSLHRVDAVLHVSLLLKAPGGTRKEPRGKGQGRSCLNLPASRLVCGVKDLLSTLDPQFGTMACLAWPWCSVDSPGTWQWREAGGLDKGSWAGEIWGARSQRKSLCICAWRLKHNPYQKKKKKKENECNAWNVHWTNENKIWEFQQKEQNKIEFCFMI